MSDFQTADAYENAKAKAAIGKVADGDPFLPIVYDDEGSEVVARIVIEWYEGEPTVEDYRSPTQAKLRWDTLRYLFTGGLTFHVRHLRLFKPVDGVFTEVSA